MPELEILVRLAGVGHLVMVAANFVIPRKLRFREDLSATSKITRQVFFVHHLYIVLTIAAFGLLCLVFPSDLAGGSPLGGAVCGFMAFFWLLRLPIQFLYYDPEVRRAHRVEDLLVSLLVVALAASLSTVFLLGSLVA